MLTFCLDNDLTTLLFWSLFLNLTCNFHPAVFVWHKNEWILEFENSKIKKISLCYRPYGSTWTPYKQRKCKVVDKKACKGCCLLKISRSICYLIGLIPCCIFMMTVTDLRRLFVILTCFLSE